MLDRTPIYTFKKIENLRFLFVLCSVKTKINVFWHFYAKIFYRQGNEIIIFADRHCTDCFFILCAIAFGKRGSRNNF